MVEAKMAHIATLCNQPAAEGEGAKSEVIIQQKPTKDGNSGRQKPNIIDEDKSNDVASSDAAADEKVFHAAAVPDPIHLDEHVLGRTHAKETHITAASSAPMTWIPVGSILLANALVVLDFVTVL